MKNFLDTNGLAAYDQEIKSYIDTKTNDSVFGASGNNHSKGLVPDPGSTEGSSKYLREDGTWAVPSGGSGGGGDVNVIEIVKVNGSALTPDANKAVDITVPSVSTAIAISNGDTGYTTGNQVYNYIETNKSSWGDTNVIETVKVNGSALSPDANKAVDITVPDSVFGASGTNHSTGLVPDPGSTAGISKYLREDGTWAVPATSGGGGDVNVIESISVNSVNVAPDANKNVNITISTASSIADNESGFATGDQVYEYVQAQVTPIQLILDNVEAILATV